MWWRTDWWNRSLWVLTMFESLLISSQHLLHTIMPGWLSEGVKFDAPISVDDVLRQTFLMITYLRKRLELELGRLNGRRVPESPTQRKRQLDLCQRWFPADKTVFILRIKIFQWLGTRILRASRRRRQNGRAPHEGEVTGEGTSEERLKFRLKFKLSTSRARI